MPYVTAGDSRTSAVLNMLWTIAQFERELSLERVLVGIAKPKAEGKNPVAHQQPAQEIYASPAEVWGPQTSLGGGYRHGVRRYLKPG